MCSLCKKTTYLIFRTCSPEKHFTMSEGEKPKENGEKSKVNGTDNNGRDSPTLDLETEGLISRVRNLVNQNSIK